ncbi:endonuclease/exonuclease/phosphatase family protein [Pedococcus sp. KACC 23699]|uniref:Endonuclease/exonuclease/phosphatase family protein n=1 Tax=Pedococcus sp. KACC 23699 TaxID=3149228 RepID=A0AAU7JZV0_9MICO
MSQATLEPPPTEVTADLADLAVALDAAIPARTDTNLLIGTWNLRALADLTAKWASGRADSPKRDWHSVACIAEVVSRMDVMAIQETRRETTAARFLLERLGDQWRLIISDVTEGPEGNGERLAFLYRADRVQPSGLVGELVLPSSAGQPTRQFARTPYAAGFTRAGVEFILTTVHVLWDKSAADRLPEITAFAQWMRQWADQPKDWNHNLLVLGDFNLDRLDDPLYQAFVSTGLFPPAELNAVPRTIFDTPGQQHFYDQIAWFSTDTGQSLLQGLDYTRRGGSFDFVPHVFPGMTLNQLSWRISDHYPLWVEFDTGTR